MGVIARRIPGLWRNGEMSRDLPQIVLVRHGETEWSASGRHTSVTDLPLTESGEANARRLGEGLRGRAFALVLTSPLRRARRTCELAGFGDVAEDEPDLIEFRYGDYEGLTTAEIRLQRPDWRLYRDGCPGGDSIEDVSARVDRIVSRLRRCPGDALIFSHAHILRCLAVRWADLPLGAAGALTLTTASVSILGHEHGPDEPVIRLWNDGDFRRWPSP